MPVRNFPLIAETHMGVTKPLCFFLPPYINLKLPAKLEAVAAKPLCSVPCDLFITELTHILF